MPKRNLTDRALKALKPTKVGTHTDVWDTVVSAFGVRVSDSDRRTFVLMARFPGSRNPVRRAIGVYGEISLADARAKAVHWKEQIGKGIDPAVAEEETRQAALRRRENTFSIVVQEYLRQHVIGINPNKPRQRNGREVERAGRLRKHLERFSPVQRQNERARLLQPIAAVVSKGQPLDASRINAAAASVSERLSELQVP